MNQAQRKFLIDKVESTFNDRIKELKREKDELETPPSLENYLYGLALTKKLVLQPKEHILESIETRAMTHTAQNYSRRTWLGTESGDIMSKSSYNIRILDLFVIPEEYTEKWSEYHRAAEAIEERMNLIKTEINTLTTRIQLASDKTLERMISEVDDMGDLSLMDMKLKSLIAGDDKKLIR